MTAPPPRRERARQALVLGLPDGAPEAVRGLAREAYAAEFDGSLLQPLREVSKAFAAAHGLTHHWFIERLVTVLTHLRGRTSRDAHSPELLDPRLKFRIAWLTHGDSECDDVHYAQADADRLMQEWQAWSPVSFPEDSSLAQMSEAALRLPLAADPTRYSRRLFQEHALKHYDARARALKSLGVPLHREATSLPDHALWFVRYQIGKESYARISKAAGTKDQPQTVERQTVEEGVKKFARLVGVTMRPPGDPPAGTA